MILRKILKYLAIFFGALLLVWCIVVGLVLTPEVLTPRVERVAQQFVKSDISIKSVDLSLFTRFPNVTLQIDSLLIPQTKDSINDLLFARECRVSVNPLALLFKKVVISDFLLSDASLYVYVDEQTGPLKTFNLPTMDEAQSEADSLETSPKAQSDYSLSIKRLRVDSLQATIDDRIKRFYTRISDYNLDMALNMSPKRSDLDVETSFSNLIVWHDGELLVKKTALNLSSKMLLDLEAKVLSFDRARIKLNGIDFKAQGTLHRDTTTQDLMVDVSSSLNTPSLAEFLNLIPSSLINGKDEITTQGSVALDLEIKGAYSPTSYPTMAATLKVDDAKAKYASRRLSLEEVSCDAYAFVDMNHPQSSYADIKSLKVNTSKILNLDVKGKVTNIVEDPLVDLAIISDIDFDRFSELFPMNEAVVCSGQNHSDITTQFQLSNITSGNYANLIIDGESIFKNLEITVDASKLSQDTTSLAHLYMRAETGRMLFGERIRKEQNSRTLRSMMNFSGLGYKAKTGEFIGIKDLELTVGASFDRSTSVMNGMGVRGIAKNMDVGVDSLVTANLASSDVSLIIKPKDKNHEMQIVTNINSQQITLAETTFGSEATLSSVLMNVVLQHYSEQELLDLKAAQTAQEEKRALKLEERRKKNGSTTKVAEAVESPSKQQEWSMNGSVAFADLSLFTQLFPLQIKVPETSVTVSPGNVQLNNARMMLGSSEIIATGNVSSLIRKIFMEPRTMLRGKLSVSAPFVNFNELLEASNHSVMMLDEATGVVDTVKVETIAAAEADSLSTDLPTTALFLVPRRMNLALDLNIEKALFEEATIENVKGLATISNGALTLKQLTLNAIGADASGSLIYRNINSTGATVAANINLAGVDINRIGEMLPEMISMFPMIKSFEGKVNFDCKLNTSLLSDGNVDISTLRSALMFQGSEMVLMDSETFAELSKTLMFKNKKRNIIESIEAFALVDQSKVDVLPFAMTIDRYKAIIGGSQTIDPATFDVDYKYNVSILKSPLPFKAGVDITGNLEDFKFKVTSAKLKNTNFEKQRAKYEEYRDSIE